MEELTIAKLKEELSKKGLSVKGDKSTLIKRLRKAEGEEPSRPEQGEQECSQDLLGPDDSVSQVSRCSSIIRKSKTSMVSEYSTKEGKEGPSMIVKALKVTRSRLHGELSELEETLEIYDKRTVSEEESVIVGSLTEKRILVQGELARLEKVLEKHGQEPACEGGTGKHSNVVKSQELNVNADVFRPGSSPGSSLITPQETRPARVINAPTTGQHHIEPVSQEGRDSSREIDPKLLETMIAFNLKSTMPKAEVIKFSGDSTKYNAFIRTFETVISDKLNSEDEKLMYLERYTLGRPNEIVSTCLDMPPGKGYKEARRMLHRRYGRDEVITNSYVNKIMNWPRLKEGDVEGMEEFSLALIGCRNVLKNGTEGGQEMELSSTLKKIVMKLPFSLQERWRSKIYKTRYVEFREARFNDLVEFTSMEVEKMSDAVYGRHVMEVRDKPRENGIPKKEDKVTSQDKNKSKVKINTVVGQEEQRTVKCLFCNKEHYLDECEDLRKKPDKERIDFVKDNHLCFGCLRKGHSSKECKKRKVCKICKWRHPTCLHRDATARADNVQPSDKDDVKQGTSGDQDGSSSKSKPARVNSRKAMSAEGSSDKLPIILIKVRGTNGDLIPTYAFLDSGSTTTFCTRDLLGKLTHQKVRSARLRTTTMYAKNVMTDCEMVTGIEVCDYYENDFVSLPPVYTVDEIPVSKEDIVTKGDLEHWPHLQCVDLPDIDADIGLLLGFNVFPALRFGESISGPKEDDPGATKTRLGWMVWGSTNNSTVTHVRVNRVKVEDVTLDNLLVNMYNQEFMDVNSTKRGLSEEDKRWMAQVEESCRIKNTGHYEIGMPFRDRVPTLPNNKKAVISRLDGLKRRLSRDDRFHKDYCSFMSSIIDNGYAEEVPLTKVQAQDAWYIPHHGVYHHQKTDQLRVVFDCAAKYRGTSLNDVLLQGPDLTNSLVEVLLKFRQYPFAFMADIKSMFYQVAVPEKDRDYLRFFWWHEGNFHGDPIEYRMTVHPFGAKSSPSCANFALRKAVTDHSKDCTLEAKHTVLHNFYVDDCLKSAESEKELVKIAHEVKEVCSRGGFSLTKFVSNSRELLTSLLAEERGKNVKELDLCHDALPTERALGISWNIEVDTMNVSVKDKERPLTRRGILSTIGSMYDPLGIVSPFLLQGRLIMQDLCRLKVGWDELIPEHHQVAWTSWKQSMAGLDSVHLDRCIKPKDFGEIVSSQVHHFSDASEKGYGTCTYLRLCDSEGRIHCAFLFGKAHVAPLKAVTIPRLELTAAVSAVRVNNMITNALEIPVHRTVFWTDSTTVLKYIRNDSARFHTFVANRLSIIHDGSEQDQWKYVNTELNPADDASRGIQSECWLTGPEFLHDDEKEWPEEPLVMDEEGLEIKIFAAISNCKLAKEPLERLLQHYSSWHRLRKAVAWILRVRATLLSRARRTESVNLSKALTMKEIDDAGQAIVKVVQRESFSKEMLVLSKGDKVGRNSSLRKLNPVIHDGVLRVGGRLSETSFSFDVKHPIILPGKHHVTDLIIRDQHEKVGHQGREHVLSSLRETYWIIKGNTAVRKVVGQCIRCRKNQASVMQQLMANLPGDTVYPCEPPFTCTGVDCFGPFYTKRGRSEVKRYGVIFTCLTVHAIHIEVAESLSTDSFINALRRFIARRGQVKSIRCDRGTNFVGAERELREAMNGWNQASISEKLLLKGIDWTFNPPPWRRVGETN